MYIIVKPVNLRRMKDFKYILTLLLIVAVVMQTAAKKTVYPYQNAQLPVQERVNDLLSRMTVEEKIGQLMSPFGWETYVINGDKVMPSEHFKQLVREQHIGMLWGTYRADPWTKKTLENGLNPELAAKCGNALQKYVIENTRLGIPMFLAEEAPHGHMAIGTTVFPTGYGLAATWDTSLMEEIGKVIGKEVRSQGGHISYGPVLDLSRDPRWSRVEETFGEDPVLTGELGAAEVRGLGGGRLSEPYATVATLKHFLAYAIPEGGQNGNFAQIGPRELREQFLPPFRKAVEAGALSVMSSYNSIDGIPCTANSYLFRDILQKEWNFKGFTVSDLLSINGLCGTHHIVPTDADAAVAALKAGINVDLDGSAFRYLKEAIEQGKVSVSLLDEAVGKVLKLKFEMGLFEHPYVEVKKAKENVRTSEHVGLALRAAQESVTLLENKHQMLPLKKNQKIALIGPNADNIYNMLGDYTAPQPEEVIKTVFDGIKTKVAPSQLVYVKGCAIRDTANSNIQEAISAARQSDVVVAVVGGSSARDFKTSYKDTGAAETEGGNTVSDMECGEGFDRASLTLLGKQEELLKALKATGKPLVVVYIEGRPLDKVWASEQADALLTAYYPGMEGGQAIADVLFGDYNPAGRLPVSVPRSVGQLPVYYNKKAPTNHPYVEMSDQPLYAFGYGLSYTLFNYSDLRIVSKGNCQYDVTFTLTNTGMYAGDEVVQLYLHQRVTPVVEPLKQLKAFQRVYLQPGESKHITLTLTKEDLEIVNASLQCKVFPGTFDVMVGAASNDIRLNGSFTVE